MVTIEQLKTLNIPEKYSNNRTCPEYEDDKPLPSCLILGFSVKSEYIHIVVCCDTDFIYLIPAYFPDPDIWEADFKARKGC